jgi:hypothetical protein
MLDDVTSVALFQDFRAVVEKDECKDIFYDLISLKKMNIGTCIGLLSY